MNVEFTDEVINFIMKRMPEINKDNIDNYIDKYRKIPLFDIHENLKEVDCKLYEEIMDDVMIRFIQNVTAYYLKLAMIANKMNVYKDANIKDDLDSGNIGTFGRLAKIWTGSSMKDDRELLSGRWSKEPRLAVFPNNSNINQPVFIKAELNAVCSHHMIRFGPMIEDKSSFVIIGYIPTNDRVLGISKINRFVTWCATRGWLQEDLTNYIGKKIMQISHSEDVYVGLFNIQHGCAVFRGAKDSDACTTSIFASGKFKENPQLAESYIR